jgi:hypothetical protein
MTVQIRAPIICLKPKYRYGGGVAGTGTLGQLTAVDDSSDSGKTFCYTPDMVQIHRRDWLGQLNGMEGSY